MIVFCVLGFSILAHWRRWFHPTPVLLPGKSHGRRSLLGCSPWGCEESDKTERLHFHFSLSCIGEGNGNPLPCSCLEKHRHGGAWWLPSMGSHRVGHDWSGLAAAAAILYLLEISNSNMFLEFKVTQVLEVVLLCFLRQESRHMFMFLYSPCFFHKSRIVHILYALYLLTKYPGNHSSM